MKALLHIAIAISALLATCIPVSAEIYQYRDKKGNIVFSDNPPQGSNAKEKQLKDDGIFWSSPQEEPEPPPEKDRTVFSPIPASEKKRKRDYRDATVVMYMTDWCGYCKKAREYVRSLGAQLVEYNIDRDQDRKDEMRKKSGGSSSVPLIDIDGTIIRGYSPSMIKAALERSVSQ
jgi:glutaredoxin